MSTGYTEILLRKEHVTFKEFALRCVKAFLIEFREEEGLDAEVKDEIEERSYYAEKLEQARKELEEFIKMDSSKQYVMCGVDIHKQIESLEASKENNNRDNNKFREMIQKVEKYIPPSGRHVEFKKFMIKQLNDSITIGDFYTSSIEILKTKNFDVWRSEKIIQLNKDIQYYETGYQKKIERNKDRNEWVRLFKQSLESYEQTYNS